VCNTFRKTHIINLKFKNIMKAQIKLSVIALSLVVAFGVQSCKKDDPIHDGVKKNIPTRFKVDIPSSLSRNESNKTKSIKSDTLHGNHIYHHVNTFIHIGEKAAEVVQNIMVAISTHNINQAMSFSYVSNDDGRTKNAVVVENSDYEGATWAFEMTISDALSQGNADGGKALQVFWNTNPVKGITILKPYNIDRTLHASYPDPMYRVDYSEAGELGYGAHMFVYLAQLPLSNPLSDPYSMESMKMFAGKSGNYIDVLGNSHHPNAKFITSQTGFNYAFVASCNESANIAVAEVSLPLSSLNSSDRFVILKDNSIKNVFTTQIYQTWPNIDSTTVAAYLYNTDAPGYFNSNGFIQGGTAPSLGYSDIEARMNMLSPYNPYSVATLTLYFK